LPSRFPLDETTSSKPETSSGAADFMPKLSGLSTINPGLIERDSPPQISGWTLEVPLDEQDLIYECLRATGHGGLEGENEAGDAMQVDDHVRAKNLNGKGKEKNKIPSEGEKLDEQPIKVRIQTAAMGMGGNFIVALGTRGRIWVYRKKTVDGN
jgi:hypothetical protein